MYVSYLETLGDRPPIPSQLQPDAPTGGFEVIYTDPSKETLEALREYQALIQQLGDQWATLLDYEPRGKVFKLRVFPKERLISAIFSQFRERIFGYNLP